MASRKSENDSPYQVGYEQAHERLRDHEELRLRYEELRLSCNKLEKALEESEARFLSLFDNSTDAILLSNPDGTMLSANPAACRMFQMTEEEITWAGRDGLMVKDDRLRAALLERKRKGKVKAELTFKRKDGTTFVGEVSSGLFADAEGVVRTSLIIRDITERKQAEKELQIAMERFYLILSNMPYGILLVTADNRIEFVNQVFCDMFALKDPPVELRNLSSSEMLGKIRSAYRDADDAMVRIGEILASGQPVRGEEVAMHGNRTVLRDFIPIRLNGKLFGRLWIHVDISERKRGEDALKESEERYRLLHDTMLQAVVYQDADGNILSMNTVAESILGVGPDEFIGSSSVGQEDFCIREDGSPFPGLEHPAMVALRTGRKVEKVIMGVWNPQSEEYRWISIDAIPLFKPGEGKPYQVYTLFDDITDRKKAEETLKESEAQLARAQQISHIGSWSWDLVTDEVAWSDQSYRIFGLAPREVVPTYELFLSFVVPEDRCRVDQTVRKAIETGAKYEVMYRIVRKDGVPRILMSENEIVTDESGRVVRMFGANQDITERKEMEVELRRSNAALQQFAYMASHDLRQPLAVISSYLDLLQEEYDGKVMDENAQRYIERAISGSRRLDKMIDSLLQFSRVSRSGESFESTDMNRAMDQAEQNLATIILESKAVITRNELPTINASPQQMVQVLQNLISNGIKFHGKEVPLIHVSATDETEFWQFSVQDNGIGIPKEQQERIFEMFSRLHLKGEYEGNGIGLALAMKIVERHGGRIWVESDEGKGSTFFFTIPKMGVGK